MARPKKCRSVGNFPEITIFKPTGISLPDLEPVMLGFEELEALHLADFEGKKQEEAAKIMEVSRATFGRTIEKARHTVAEALLKGKAIVIQGGEYCCNGILMELGDSYMSDFYKEKQKKCLTCEKFKAMYGFKNDSETIVYKEVHNE